MSDNVLRVFQSEEFGHVRVVDRPNGEPWFVARDVAKALGYDKPQNAVATHCKKCNKISVSPDSGQVDVHTPPVNLLIIPESDVYRLIMRSNLPSAERFQDWVVEIVLPSIRRHGAYIHESTVSPEYLRKVATKLEEQARAIKAMQPSIHFHNAETRGQTFWTITRAAAELGVSLACLRNACATLGLLTMKYYTDKTRYWPTKHCFAIQYAKLDPTGSNWGFTSDGMDYLRLYYAASQR